MVKARALTILVNWTMVASDELKRKRLKRCQELGAKERRVVLKSRLATAVEKGMQRDTGSCS